MINEFLKQLQNLMQCQNDKIVKKDFNKYSWISYKRTPVHLDPKNEVIIRRIATKLSDHQLNDVMKELTAIVLQNFYKYYVHDIPEICIQLLNKQAEICAVQAITNARMDRFHLFFHSERNFVPNFLTFVLNKFQSRRT